MCPTSNPNRKRCVDMAPADWFIASETSFINDLQDLSETLLSYNILKRIVDHTILEWRNLFEKTSNTDNGHRLGFYFTDKNFNVLKNICSSSDAKTGDSLKLPMPNQLKHIGQENRVPAMLREVEKQFYSCARSSPVQKIVILFVQKLPNKEIHKNWILDVLAKWRQITDVAVQVYVVAVSQVKDNLWTSLHTYNDRLGTDGDVFLNTYFETGAALESGLAQRVLHCACTRSRECRTATSIPCDNSECMKDCNLKPWGPWSVCYSTKRGDIKHRSRRNLTSGGRRYSEWTVSCRKQDILACVKPVGPTKIYEKLTTMPFPLIDEDYAVETLPLTSVSTMTEATTVITITTTTEWIVMGMSFPILIVAATAVCIISFACCIVATMFIFKGQGSSKRRVVVLDGGKLKKRSNFAAAPPPQFRSPTTSAPSQEEYDYGGGSPYSAATSPRQSQGYSQLQQPQSRSYEGEWDYGEPQPRNEWPAPRQSSLQRPPPTSQRSPSPTGKKAATTQRRQSKVAATYADLQPPAAYKKSMAATTPGYMTLKGFHTGSTARKLPAPKKSDANIGAYIMY
uniref:Uncharacterized protein n=1 Tax=Romanomermis culicivorax TaxID=13658 RepID=A0A915JEZ1_ROMCU